MGSAIHIKTKVLRGNKIQVPAGNLAEGESVDVFVVLPTSATSTHRSVLQMLKVTPAPGVLKTADDVDQYIRGERDQWDR